MTPYRCRTIGSAALKSARGGPSLRYFRCHRLNMSSTCCPGVDRSICREFEPERQKPGVKSVTVAGVEEKVVVNALVAGGRFTFGWRLQA